MIAFPRVRTMERFNKRGSDGAYVDFFNVAGATLPLPMVVLALGAYAVTPKRRGSAAPSTFGSQVEPGGTPAAALACEPAAEEREARRPSSSRLTRLIAWLRSR